MAGIHILCAGKLKERFYKDACDEYLKRFSRYQKAEVVEIPEERLGDAPSENEIAQALEKEAKKFRTLIPKGSYVVALCVEGESVTSAGLSQLLANTFQVRSDMTFIIGSSFGLAESIKKEADKRLSLSPLTFPHHLARVIVLEQLYRAFNRLSGGQYDK